MLVLLLSSSPVYAFDKWDNENILFQTIATTLTVIDWGQTRGITESDEYYETNPILGKYPTVKEVNQYFTTCILLQLAVSHVLPNPYRKYFQIFYIGIEAVYVQHNYRMGIRINF